MKTRTTQRWIAITGMCTVIATAGQVGSELLPWFAANSAPRAYFTPNSDIYYDTSASDATYYDTSASEATYYDTSEAQASRRSGQ